MLKSETSVQKLSAIVLAAGVGSRLKPFTDSLPKCLMPIQGAPLLQYWLDCLLSLNLCRIAVNVHHHPQQVKKFLNRDPYKHTVTMVHEKDLLGTAGTIRKLGSWVAGGPLLVIHADNWCGANLKEFIYYHINERPLNTVMTMMTFNTEDPESCGIVTVDREGIVNQFYEKSSDSNGTLANGAVYIFEQEVIQFIQNQKSVSDISLGVLPEFLGSIATWFNREFHIDVGTPNNLLRAQNTPNPWSPSLIRNQKSWSKSYEVCASEVLVQLNKSEDAL